MRRASRIASKSSAELMVVHVVRGDGLAGCLGAADGQGARARRQPRRDAAHRRRRRRPRRAAGLRPRDERHPAGARHVAAVALGAHLRRGHRRGRRCSTPGRSTCTWSPTSEAQPRLSLAAAVAAPATPGVLAGGARRAVGDLRGHRACCSTRFLGIGGESALFFVGVLVVALLGGVAPGGAVGAAVGPAAQLLPHRTRGTASPSPNPTAPSPIVVLLAVAVAVAALVDGAASRAREARRASQEAELLALFAGSVLRGADLTTLLERVRETYSQRAVSLLRGRRGDRRAASAPIRASTSTPPTPPSRSGDDEFWLLLAGQQAGRPRPPGAVRRRQAGGGPGPAARTHRGGRAGRGDRAGRRTAPVAAVGGQPRPAHPAGRRQGRGVQPAQRRRRASPPRTPPNCWPPSRSRSTS